MAADKQTGTGGRCWTTTKKGRKMDFSMQHPPWGTQLTSRCSSAMHLEPEISRLMIGAGRILLRSANARVFSRFFLHASCPKHSRGRARHKQSCTRASGAGGNFTSLAEASGKFAGSFPKDVSTCACNILIFLSNPSSQENIPFCEKHQLKMSTHIDFLKHFL
jgi:hypothetical protein